MSIMCSFALSPIFSPDMGRPLLEDVEIENGDDFGRPIDAMSLRMRSCSSRFWWC
jgi:hypothetical protein